MKLTSKCNPCPCPRPARGFDGCLPGVARNPHTTGFEIDLCRDDPKTFFREARRGGGEILHADCTQEYIFKQRREEARTDQPPSGPVAGDARVSPVFSDR
jgi:hypothetical protein